MWSRSRLALIALIMSATPAVASTVTPTLVTINPGDAAFSFDAFIASASVPTATAKAVVDFLGTSNGGKTFAFDYTLTNTSSGAGNFNISSIGFNVPNFQTFAFVTPGPFADDNTIYANRTTGSGEFSADDICLYAGSTCNGGGNSGIIKGQTTHGAFDITFASVPTDLQLSDFDVKFQNAPTNSTFGTSTFGPPPVPELPTWSLMIIGIGGIGVTARRRQSRLAKPATSALLA
jgi:hypothetical protein